MKGLKRVGEWTPAYKLCPGDMIWYPAELGFRLLTEKTTKRDFFVLTWVSQAGNVVSIVEKTADDTSFFKVTD
jgi:hypothetical protein